MSKNSVLDGLRSNLLEFIQESMSEKIFESISIEEVEFEGVKEMYSWVSSILSLKNWRNELASDCVSGVSGDELDGCGGELNLKFSKVCEGWRMIQ